MSSAEFVILSLVFISFALAITCFSAWALFNRPRHALIWGFCYVGSLLQYSTNIWREQLPSQEFYWLTSSFISFLTITGVFWGHRERLLRPTQVQTLLLMLAGITGIMAVATLMFGESSLKVAVAPAYAAGIMFYVAVLLWQEPRFNVVVQRIAALVHGAFGLTQALAAMAAMAVGPDRNPQYVELYTLFNFGLMPAAFVAMGLSVFMLMATDLSARLTSLALTDVLTGLTNRRGFGELAQRRMAMARRSSQPLSIIIVDIDFFKSINDDHGHVVGDKALQHIARVFTDVLRIEDALCRIGGEEFAVLLSDRPQLEAVQVAERLRGALAESPFRVGRKAITITASFGIAQWQSGETWETLTARADAALYSAKAEGRDQVSLAPAMPELKVITNRRKTMPNSEAPAGGD